jgi:branched-chain amino acid transport system substrate-binding protein
MTKRPIRLLAFLAALGLLAAACGSSDTSSEAEAGDSDEATGTSSTSDDSATDSGSTGGSIKLGASLPLTGSLGAFGPLIQAGYEKAVAEVNADGGLVVGDTTYEVELVVRDNMSDGNEAAAQARDLVVGEEVVGLLGAVTPPLTIPISVVAEQNQTPLISSLTPIRAWLGGNEEGWNYSFDLFFDELQMTDLQYQAADLVDTNKKVALFTDLEEDGIVMGGLWADKAEPFGYEIVAHLEFPVGTTNFSTQVAEAADAGAEIVIAQIIPPDAIALLKEMKTQGYQPQVMFIEKGGNFGAFTAATEGIGEGVMAASWFAAGQGTPREQEFIDEFTPLAGGANSDLGAVVMAYTASKVMLDAISDAGSLEADDIVAAIEAIDADYPAGPINFAEDHSNALPAIMTQWAGFDMRYVTRVDGTAGPETLIAPVSGLG